MSTVTFDTLNFVRTLKAAGVPESQAEAEAKALQEAFAEMVTIKDLATKTDVQEMKYDLLKWMVGIGLAQVSLLIGILLKLMH